MIKYICERKRGSVRERESGVCLILRRGGEERLQILFIMMFVARIVNFNQWRKHLLGTDVNCIYGVSTLSTAFILIDVLIIQLLFAYICFFFSACVKVLFFFFCLHFELKSSVAADLLISYKSLYLIVYITSNQSIHSFAFRKYLISI